MGRVEVYQKNLTSPCRSLSPRESPKLTICLIARSMILAQFFPQHTWPVQIWSQCRQGLSLSENLNFPFHTCPCLWVSPLKNDYLYNYTMFYPERRYWKGMLNFSERPQPCLCCGKIWTGQVCCLKNGKVKDCVIVQIVRGIVRGIPMDRLGSFRSLVQVRAGANILWGSIASTGLTWASSLWGKYQHTWWHFHSIYVLLRICGNE